MLALILLALWSGIESQGAESGKVRQFVEQYVASRMMRTGVQYVMEFRKIPAIRNLSSDDVTCRIGSDAPARLKGYVGIPVEIVAGKTVAQRIVVPVRIRTYGQVLLIAKQYGKHQAIEPDDVLSEIRETTMLGEDVLTDVKQVIGRRAVRILSSHTILQAAHLEESPAVRQNDVVTISVRGRAVAITRKGVAKEDGCLGAFIAVQPDGSHDRVRARVVSEAQVEIDLVGSTNE